MPISSGDNVGPYRVIEPLGQGGMATVFKAYHPALDRYVAIKVLHPAFKEDPNFNARFTREARIVAKLDHPNIVPIYDFAEHQGTPYLVMRFVEGKTLKAVLRDGLLPVSRVLAIVHPVTEALAYAHAQGILHRDIKPSNIMRANDGHIYLADFGLARIAQAGDSTMSQDMLIGTPQYISPEQARGELATERSDIYSLGVVLFEMFTGRVPFSADTPYAIIHDHIYTALPLPTAINPNLSKDVERVLLKALAKDANARYASATELMSALEQAEGIDAANVATISPPPAPLVPILPPPTLPEPIAPMPGAVTPATPKITAAPALDLTPVLPQPRRSSRGKILVALGAMVLAFLLCGGIAFAIGQRSAISKMLGVPFGPPDPASAIKTKAAANPQDPATFIQLAEEYAKQKDFEAAFAAYDRAIKLAPRNARAYVQAGRLATRLGDFERANKYFSQGRNVAPDDLELLLAHGDLFFEWKKYDDARATYERALKNDPNNAQLLWRLANAQRMLGQLADALRNYTRALAIDPNLPEAHFGMGMLMLERGNKDEARRQFQMIVANPNAPPELKEQAQKNLDALGEK
ncbi:MAG: protein kinase [Anaerolineales bacterium]|nr:protein kinase [Anaerolineales bacterium]